MRVSPGGAWVVLNFIERALRQPGLAPLKAGLLLRRLRLRWRQMSAWRHSGKLFKTLIEKREKRGFSQSDLGIIEKDLHLKAGLLLVRLWLRWRQMSAWRHSWKLFKTLIEKRKKRGFSQIEIRIIRKDLHLENSKENTLLGLHEKQQREFDLHQTLATGHF